MPNKQRRKDEKELLRGKILAAAKYIAVEDGWQNVTIRKICDQIHYTAPVVYQYFESKEALLIALRNEGFIQVFTILESVNAKHLNPEKRLMEYGIAWWNFAMQYSEVYQIMFNIQGAICVQSDSTIKVNNNVMEYYHPEFIRINNKAAKSALFRLELTDNYIALIHGFISMNMANKIKSPENKLLSVYKSALQRFINSINDKTNNNE